MTWPPDFDVWPFDVDVWSVDLESHMPREQSSVIQYIPADFGVYATCRTMSIHVSHRHDMITVTYEVNVEMVMFTRGQILDCASL